jgi:hypothetical protein
MEWDSSYLGGEGRGDFPYYSAGFWSLYSTINASHFVLLNVIRGRMSKY